MRNGLVLVSALVLPPVAVAPRFDAEVRPVRTEVCAAVSIGLLPQEVEVGGRSVRFTEWTMDQEGGDVVGFAAQLPEGVRAELRVGDVTFTTQRGRWFHPALRKLDAMSLCGAQVEPVVAMRE
jgi:hypothetical protein